MAGLVLVVRETKDSGGCGGGGGKGWDSSPGSMAAPPKASIALKRLRAHALPFNKLDK